MTAAARAARLVRRRPGLVLALLVAVAFAAIYADVLLGLRSLVPENILYNFAPLQEFQAGHRAANTLVGDVAVQHYPWFSLTRTELLSGRLPLWNPFSRGGSALLANAQSAVLSPFTLLAVPFKPSYGFSLAMLARMWVAGLGAAIFIRTLGAWGVGAALGGLAYGTSSYIVVWLGYPLSSVACFAPFAFAAAEWLLSGDGGLRAVGALGLSTGLLVLAGHPETMLQFGVLLTVYVAARWLATGRSRRSLAGLLLGALIGAMVSAVIALPFLRASAVDRVIADRLALGLGRAHQPLTALASWMVPNRYGNPGLDGRVGPSPNYAEATGFVGVWTLVFAAAGAALLWRRDRALAATLAAMVLLPAGIVYGPLTAVTSRLPILAASGNERFVAGAAMFVAVLAGLGIDGLLARSRRPVGSGWLASALVAVVAPAALAVFFILRGRAVDDLGRIGPWLGFWVVFAAACLVAAILLLLAARHHPAPAVAGLAGLALIEAAVFAVPYNVRTYPQDVPPPSPFLTRARDIAGNTPTALEFVIPPESAMLYGLRDENGYDALTSPRTRDFWRASNPGYSYKDYHLLIGSPPVEWLRAAGVTHLIGPRGIRAAGLEPMFGGGPAEFYRVAGAHDLAFVPRKAVTVPGERQALAAIRTLPIDGAVFEQAGGIGTEQVLIPSQSVVLAYRAGAVDIAVTGPSPVRLVVSEGYDAGWKATVDGRTVAVQPANVTLVGMDVPGSGRRIVRLRYQPSDAAVGGAVSLLGLAGVAVLGVLPLRRQGRANAAANRIGTVVRRRTAA